MYLLLKKKFYIILKNEQKNKRKPVTVGGVRGNYSKKYNKNYF